MNFSGTLDESGGMTVTRLIERIVHTDTPGELRLHDETSGRRAAVVIRRGTVEDVHFGELSGDAALTAISQTMPWTFEFVADESGAMPAHPGIVSRRPRARAVVKRAPAAAPVEEALPPEPEFPFTPAQMEWLASADSAHSIRFGVFGAGFSGPVEPDDHAYFRSDCDYLRSTAAAIARSLGLEPPRVFAIAEEERAAGYRDIPGGFLGIMAGAGAGVQHVILFPDE